MLALDTKRMLSRIAGELVPRRIVLRKLEGGTGRGFCASKRFNRCGGRFRGSFWVLSNRPVDSTGAGTTGARRGAARRIASLAQNLELHPAVLGASFLSGVVCDGPFHTVARRL